MDALIKVLFLLALFTFNLTIVNVLARGEYNKGKAMVVPFFNVIAIFIMLGLFHHETLHPALAMFLAVITGSVLFFAAIMTHLGIENKVKK